jgi:hypothetical protein
MRASYFERMGSFKFETSSIKNLLKLDWNKRYVWKKDFSRIKSRTL